MTSSTEPDQAKSNDQIQNENLTSATTNEKPDFGWSSYAERVNGRFAMIGFTSLLIIELISNDSFIHWAGFLN